MTDAAGLVLWDFDNTLAHRPGMWRGALRTALTSVDPASAVTDDDLRPFLRGGFLWHSAHRAHPEIVTADDWWARMTPLFVGAYVGAGVDRSAAETAAARLPEVYVDPAFWMLFPDTRDALAAVRSAGMRSVVLSNHVPELPALVEALGLADLVDGVVTSALAGFEKPHPGIYAAALERSGASTGWMVGDNPVADVEGAEAAGLRGILVHDVPEHDLRWAAQRILAAG